MTTQERLGEVFVELADTLVAEFDVVEFLTTLADRCAELLRAGDAGVLIADESGVLRSVASSSEAARLLDLFELQNDEGPCLDCHRTGERITNQSLEAGQSAWPVFAAEARRLGYTYVHAFPMRLRGQIVGAVNVFTADGDGLSLADAGLAQAFTDVATIALLQEQGIREARMLSERLHAALESRVLIEQAKGMLAERRGVALETAFELMRRYARNTNNKLSSVASWVLDGSLDVAALDAGD